MSSFSERFRSERDMRASLSRTPQELALEQEEARSREVAELEANRQFADVLIDRLNPQELLEQFRAEFPGFSAPTPIRDVSRSYELYPHEGDEPTARKTDTIRALGFYVERINPEGPYQHRTVAFVALFSERNEEPFSVLRSSVVSGNMDLPELLFDAAGEDHREIVMRIPEPESLSMGFLDNMNNVYQLREEMTNSMVRKSISSPDLVSK